MRVAGATMSSALAHLLDAELLDKNQPVQGAQAISEHHTDQRNQPPAEDPRDQKLRIDKQVPEGQQCNPDRPTQSLKNPELTALTQGNRVACHQRRVIKTALT